MIFRSRFPMSRGALLTRGRGACCGLISASTACCTWCKGIGYIAGRDRHSLTNSSPKLIKVFSKQRWAIRTASSNSSELELSMSAPRNRSYHMDSGQSGKTASTCVNRARTSCRTSTLSRCRRPSESPSDCLNSSSARDFPPCGASQDAKTPSSRAMSVTLSVLRSISASSSSALSSSCRSSCSSIASACSLALHSTARPSSRWICSLKAVFVASSLERVSSSCRSSSSAILSAEEASSAPPPPPPPAPEGLESGSARTAACSCLTTLHKAAMRNRCSANTAASSATSGPCSFWSWSASR
mmetsp:Transcript_103668/g.332268  ORF Transcript_103668/g.332268 Transcript_103668/m.332268 type:complete len:300 (+) Transcript_103668:1174-2073(+)